MPVPTRHAWLEGFAFGNAEFEPSRPHSYCNLCGEHYQSPLDRTAETRVEFAVAEAGRRRWAISHSATHSEREHYLHQVSGRFIQPEALERLVPLGIIPLSDMALCDESRQAAGEAPKEPR